jgi:hypothetical protein
MMLRLSGTFAGCECSAKSCLSNAQWADIAWKIPLRNQDDAAANLRRSAGGYLNGGLRRNCLPIRARTRVPYPQFKVTLVCRNSSLRSSRN